MYMRWFNLLGFAMLLLGLFLNEVVFLNVWYNATSPLILVALAYYAVAIGLSVWEGFQRPQS